MRKISSFFSRLFYSKKHKPEMVVYSYPASFFGFDSSYCYFLLQASFGDKWMILSFLPEFIRLHGAVRVLASKADRDLIRIFIGEKELERAIIFIDDDRLFDLSTVITPTSVYSNIFHGDLRSLVQTDCILSAGIPVNTIRHLHIVKYPYFADLHIVHGVPYADLLKMLMYLPSNIKAHQPEFYSNLDREMAKEILTQEVSMDSCGIILFNVVNISHKPFAIEQIRYVISAFSSKGFRILINISGHKDEIFFRKEIKETERVSIITIPGHLLALVSSGVSGVFGVIGGAMCVATYFSKNHALSIFSQAAGYNLGVDRVHAGRVADNIWKIDEEAWPFQFPGRVAGHVDGGDLTTLNEKKIIEIVDNFVKKISVSSEPL